MISSTGNLENSGSFYQIIAKNMNQVECSGHFLTKGKKLL